MILLFQVNFQAKSYPYQYYLIKFPLKNQKISQYYQIKFFCYILILIQSVFRYIIFFQMNNQKKGIHLLKLCMVNISSSQQMHDICLQIQQKSSSKFIEFQQQKKLQGLFPTYSSENNKYFLMSFPLKKSTELIFRLYQCSSNIKQQKGQIRTNSIELLKKLQNPNIEEYFFQDQAQDFIKNSTNKCRSNKEKNVYFDLQNQPKIGQQMKFKKEQARSNLILNFKWKKLVIVLQCYLGLCLKQQECQRILDKKNQNDFQPLNTIVFSQCQQEKHDQGKNLVLQQKKNQIKINIIQEEKNKFKNCNKLVVKPIIQSKEKKQNINQVIQFDNTYKKIKEKSNSEQQVKINFLIRNSEQQIENQTTRNLLSVNVHNKKCHKSSEQLCNSQLSLISSNTLSFIGSVHQAPEFMKQANLTNGYRINFVTFKDIFDSLFMIHNQTVNIWSHLIGAILVLILLTSFIVYEYDHLFVKVQSKKIDSFQKIYQKQDNLILKNPSFSIIQKMTENNLCESQFQSCSKKSKNTTFLKNKNYTCKIQADQMFPLKEYFSDQINQKIQKKKYVFVKGQCDISKNTSKKNSDQKKGKIYNFVKQQLQFLKHQADRKELEFLEMGHQNIRNTSHVSRWPVIFYLFSCFICLICSASFHLFFPMSSKAYKVSISLDYAGINILVGGTMTPILYYGMYCQFQIAQIYIISCSSLALIMFALSLTDWFNKASNFSLKATCYILLCAVCLIPIFHMVIYDMFFNTNDNFSFNKTFKWYLVAAASYGIGSFTYLFRCPQKNRPKKYDLCGHSHQIWHAFVLNGMAFIYIGVIACFQQRKQCPCLN